MTIKIEFPADRADLAKVFSEALAKVGIAPAVAQSVSDFQKAVTSRVFVDQDEGPLNDAEIAEDDDNGPADPNAPEHDSEGLVWDERIHASTKTQNADGSWKLRRKPADHDTDSWSTYVDQIKGELRDGPAAPTPPATPTPPEAPEAPEAPAAPTPPSEPEPTADQPVTFAALMKRAASELENGAVKAMCDQFGYTIPQLAQDPNKVSEVYNTLFPNG